ncbi:MAG: twin-arginine translocase TatA/TatE family subunit [Novosphingobium sp.]|nr:twin-arginine translocase TatA/TatE family subunit [Novosphingobium sp.]
MFGLSPIHLLLLALVVLVLFGRGKISEFMGDFGKGIKSFKEGMNDDTSHVVPTASQIAPPVPVAPAHVAPVQAAPVHPAPVQQPLGDGVPPQGPVS